MAFLLLFSWGRRSPLPALVCGLVLCVTLYAVEAVIEPESLLRGIVLRVLTIAVLAAGVWRELIDRRALRAQGKAVVAGA